MNNQIQVVLKSSTTEMSLNDHDAGIYIVPELDGLTGLPEIRTTSGVNAGYDGGWTSAQKFDARSIVIRGVIANDDKTEVERMRRELVALLAQGKNEQLELDFVTETGRAYEVQVRTIACDMAMQRVLTQQEFMITLRADDPLIYDNSSAGEEATVNISGATGGFRIPFEIPLAIDAGSEETVVQNSGLESVAPTIKMYGALHNPKIINHTTNQAMQVEAELGFTEGAWTTPVDAPEGTNVSFEPEREAPIESAKLEGDTYQQTYTGKNLLKLTQQTSTSNGITATLSNGVISYSGTASSNWANIAARTYNAIPAGTYMLSMQETFSSNYAYALSVTYTDNTTATFETWQSVSNKRSVTFAKDVASYYVYFTGLSSGTSYSGKISLMLESGSTATTPFEPYTGGASPNPDYPQAVQTVTGENTVKIRGKNLCNGTNQNYWLNAAANSAGRTTGNSGLAISVSANTSYTVSTKSSQARYRAALVDTLPTGNTGITAYSGQTEDGTSNSITINSGSHSYLIVNATDLAAIQIELGTSASDWEAYQEQSYSISLGNIELCKIGDYQDYIWKDGDTWKVHKAVDKIILDGNTGGWTAWSYSTLDRYYTAALSNKIAGLPQTTVALLSHFKFFGVGSGVDSINKCLFNMSSGTAVANGNITLTFKKDSMPTAASVSTWLSNNPVSLYYSLATPTDTAITNTALIEQLEALVDGNAVVYEGETNIAVTAAEGDMPGIAAIRYYTDKEPDQRDELIIDSRLKTITLNGLDVYHLQAPGSEFLMLAPGENKLSLQSDITGDNGYAKVSYKQGYLSI